MSRRNRIVLVDHPHHIVQRGNCSQQVFLDANDYRRYLALLEKYAEINAVRILAYCLMGNHVHLLASPTTAVGLGKTMHTVAGFYSRFHNAKYDKKGHVWESRFYSSVVDSHAYRWSVGLYIDCNPVRAKLVEKPEDWEYSSARHHAGIESNPIITERLFDKSDEQEYRRQLAQGPHPSQVEEIRKSASGNWPVGNSEFVTRVCDMFGQHAHRTPGHPRILPPANRKNTR